MTDEEIVAIARAAASEAAWRVSCDPAWSQEDLTQEAYAAMLVLLSGDGVAGRSRVAARAKGGIRDALRRGAGRRATIQPPHFARSADPAPSSARDVRAVIDARLDVETITARLPVRDKEILRMRMLEGHSLRQVADAHGVSGSRISQIVSATLRALRQ